MTASSTPGKSMRRPLLRWLRGLVLLLLHLPLLSRAQGNQGLVPDSTEARVLHQLYLSTGGDQWAYRTNWPTSATWPTSVTSADFATWAGVGVSNGDVTLLSLLNANLLGALPASLGQLDQLRFLNLTNNPGLTGPLPASIGRLTQLQYLYMGNCHLSGSLPAALGNLTNLLVLNAGSNRFTGALPAQLAQLTQLQRLELGNDFGMQLGEGNAITGGLPAFLGQLTSLSYLDLSLNPLGGPIPPELGRLTNLSFLELDGCRLTGEVPAAVTQLLPLRTLILGYSYPYYPDGNTFTRLPAPSTFANLAGTRLLIGYNQFDFGTLEPYFSGPGQSSWASNSVHLPQTLPQDEQSVGVDAGQPVTLTSAIGGAHTHYQWQRQVGTAWTSLNGATVATYALPSTTLADAGAYRCQATNDWVTNLTLTTRTYRLDVRTATARNLPDDTNTGLALATPRTAVDAVAAKPADVNYVRTWIPQVPLTEAGATAPASALPASPTGIGGMVLREQWDNVPGIAVSAIPLNSLASSTSYLTDLDGPVNVGDHYGDRTSGYLIAPQTGNYTFWISGDDNSELWLSRSTNSTSKRRVAYVPGYTGYREFNKYAEQQSDTIHLVQGQRYYLEMLHKEESGGDNVSIAWRLPDNSYQAPIEGQYLAPPAIPTSGVVVREQWDNVPGTSITQIPLGTAATSASYLMALEGPLNIGDNYGDRIQGYLVAPQTGTYTFWIAGDDNSEFWLSSDADPKHKLLRATVFGWTYPHEWTRDVNAQQSGPISLVAGQRYYLEIRHKEADGGDHVAVAWVLPDGSQYQQVVGGQYLAPYFTPSSASGSNASQEETAPSWSVAQAQITTQYLDGLGRPVQTVRHQASPQHRDLVQPQAYDALDREPRQYLPFPDSVAGGHGDYHHRALTEQQRFYYRTTPVGGGQGPLAADDPIQGVARTGAAYAETQFEASPLNRVLAQGAAGEAWQLGAGHAPQRLERPNTRTDSVLRFAPGYDPRSLDPGYQGLYAEGELWGTQVTDEHGGRSIEWKDKLGQVVLKQVGMQPKTVGAALRWLRTCYVYDDFQRLRFVLQPEGSKRVLSTGTQPAALPVGVERFRFHYRYDGRGRQIAKQVPGQEDETLVVYDQLDRPVLSQDAQQRTRREWSWMKYDALGRTVLTGLVTRADTMGQVRLQALATADTATSHQYEQRTANAANAQHYTTDQAFPQLGQQGFGAGLVLTASYYDDYDFDNDGQVTDHYKTDYDWQFAAGSAPVADELRTTGLATRTLTQVLNRPASDPGADWVQTTTFYDARARPVQVQTVNARDRDELLTTQLDFTGRVLKSVVVHRGPDYVPVVVAETFTYDHMGRLLTTGQQLSGETQPTQLASVTYNELGQVTRKTLGAGRLQQDVDYAYNIRGWLTKLNDPAQPVAGDLFNLSLHYETGFTKGFEQYNGNLTGQTWRGRDGVQRAYGYDYDPANRLLQGDFVARAGGSQGTLSTAMAWTTEADNYQLTGVRYDDNGNILSLQRRGLLQNANRLRGKQYGAVDNLAYAYVGNRLQAVDDQVTGNQLAKPASYHGAPTSLAGDFQEAGVRQGQEYLYDANGNLTQDKNKGITGIKYNHLNLPRQIQFGTGADSLVFRYTAAGQKVAKLVYQTGQPVQRTDYLGPFQYEQDSLKFFPHAEGRVLRFTSKDPAGQAHISYQREFTVKDHLGNLRLAYRLGQTRTYSATLEQDTTTRKRETQQFDSLSVSIPVAQPVGINLARTGSYVALLNAGGPSPQPIGPLTQLTVQKGDTLRVNAPGRYLQPVNNQSFAFSLVSFVANLLQPAPAGGPPRADGSRRGGLPLLQVGLNAGSLTALTQLSSGVPKGYLRVLIFNQDSVLVDQRTVQLTQAALTSYEVLQTGFLPIAQDGYVTVYVGNESPVDVLFDDVQVEYRQGLLVQETQYDPAGLELAGLAPPSPGIRGLNNYRFNGQEIQADLGLAWNHQNWRFFDPQIMRWHSVDPLVEMGQESWSPYAFGYDNAVRYSDADGRAPGDQPAVTYLNKTGNVQTVSEAHMSSSYGTAKNGIRTATTTVETASIDIIAGKDNNSFQTSNASTKTQTETHTQHYDAETKTWVNNNDSKTNSSTASGIDNKKFSDVGTLANKVQSFGFQKGKDFYDTVRDVGKSAMGMATAGAMLPLGISGMKMGYEMAKALGRVGVGVSPATGNSIGSKMMPSTIILSVGSYAEKVRSYNEMHPPEVRAMQQSLHDGVFWLYNHTIGGVK
ncbi:MAG: DUF6443 domain-containing protein [Janthinobacterium lividum]